MPDNYSDESVILDFTYVEKTDPPIIADKDAIVCIAINGMESEMDGSVRYATYKTGDISVDVDIVDYDKAAAVYDVLPDTIREPFLKKLSFYEGTHWSATGNTEDDEWFDYLDLRKYENGYRLRIDIPIKH